MTNKVSQSFLLRVLFILLSLLSLWLKTITSFSFGKCIIKERDALLDFKAQLQDPHGHLSTWKLKNEKDSSQCCTWNSVTCNEKTGHVVQLDLSSYKLEGKISPSLSNLAYLIDLNLSRNSFSGTIPMFIGSMTRLRYLDLSFNSFSGTIPMSIGLLNELVDLSLSNNSLLNGSCIPREFGNLTKLQLLHLENLKSCTIENIDWLSRMANLSLLNMYGTSLAKANNWVNMIISLQKLSYLNLEGCDLSHVMHPYSSSFVNSSSSSIFSLYLGYNNLNSSANHWLLPLTSNKLDTLELSGNMLDGISFGNLCSLTYLDFSSNSVVVKLPDFLNNWSGCTSVTLQYLQASQSRFTGSLSDNIQMFSSLEVMYLDNNELNGSISEKVWELPKLEVLDISFNHLNSTISENIGKSKLQAIYLSNNSLKGVLPEAHMSNLSYVDTIDLSSCNLGPRFPIWIQNLKNLSKLSIADNRISDTIPLGFWNASSSQFTYMNLSSNNISGEVQDLLSRFDPNRSLKIDLSSNNFYGSILNVPNISSYIDLSRNKFHGGISFLCQIFEGELLYLDLSHNSFVGKLPDCLWHFRNLKVLHLGYNNLFGRLPAYATSLIGLEVLSLYNNRFSGELPSSLENCTDLMFLDLGANMFTGNVPVWIGEKLSRLYVLGLSSNKFLGQIPSQICQLSNLQLLDLSMNNLHGTIPSCMNSLTAMVKEEIVHTQYTLIPFVNYIYSYVNDRYVDHAMIRWQGNTREFTTNLWFLKGIDLSSNNLTGQIPYELTDLHGLLALNLSNNALLGKIPHNISEMKNLLALDLSRNKLSGRIPSTMSEMFSLGYLDVSYNRLSGRIPSSTQLQSFEPLRYTGNAGLCGLPLPKCPGDEDSEVPAPIVRESEDGGKELGEFWRCFYIGVAIGFIIAFWIVCYTLLLSRHGHVFFHFLNSLQNMVYVKVVVLIAEMQRFSCIVSSF